MALTEAYEALMFSPRRGPGVCQTCFNLIDRYDRCYSCRRQDPVVAAMVPISYSVAGEPLHAALAGYKRLDGAVTGCFAIELGAVLWRFLAKHEACVAQASGVSGFDIVTTVPSGDPARDDTHPLHWMVGELAGPARRRYERLLRRSTVPVPSRQFSSAKYLTTRWFHGEAILLIDDTWTTGASARSAAAALMEAGSGPVGVVAIGRHLNRPWGPNDERLRSLPPFDWDVCALCAPELPSAETEAGRRILSCHTEDPRQGA